MSTTTSPLAPFHHFPATFDSGLDIPEPFGYTTILNPQSASTASSALPADRNPGSTQTRNKSLETPKSTFSQKLPVYFNHLAGKVGLVCGRENHTKYRVLKNLIAASWNKDREPHSCRDILCFTAENGSLEITQTITDLLQKGETGESGQNEPEVIVLTWPSNLSSLRALHASSKNVKVHPLLVHPEDVKLEHLRHVYEGRVWGSQNAVFDDLLQGSRARGVAVDLEEITLASLREKLNSNIPPWLRTSIGGQVYPGAFFFLDLNPHLSQQLDDARSDSRTNPGWMEWILQGQPRSSGLPAVQDDYSQRNPLLLCIDWTGCTPEERRVQNVLADIVLRQWVGHGRSQRQEQGQGATTGVGTIVCDNVHHYFSPQDQNPFTRSLSRLSYESILPDSTPSPTTNNHEPSQTITKPSSSNHNLLLLLTESPITIPPTLQDMSNFLILHRFTSPGWLTALEKHFHLHSSTTTTPSSSPLEISLTLLDQILDLDDKHVLLFAPPKPAFAPGIQTSPSRTSGSGSGSGGGVGYGTSQSPYFIGTPVTTTANANANVNGVIQRPKKQSSAPTPIPIGRHLTKICFSKEDHLHMGLVERTGPDVNAGRDDSDGGAPNFGVIGGGAVRRSTGDITGLQHAPAASSLSPYHTSNFGTNGFTRPPRTTTGMLLPQGGLTASPSQSVMRDRSPRWNNATTISTTTTHHHQHHHHQLPGAHSPAAHWPSREENPNHGNGNGNGFPFPSTPSSNPFVSPSMGNVNGYLHQQLSPPTPPFIPINSSDAVISRPGGISVGVGMGMGVPRRVSPPSSSSASGMSFSFGNGNGHGITPSSSTANQSSISTSFGMSPTSPIGAGFGSLGGRGTAFSPFATPNMLKTDQGEQLTAGLLSSSRTAYSASESSSRYFGAERTPQVTSLGGSRPSPQPSSERHSRTDTTSTTGSRDDASSADYVEVSPGSDFSRGFAPRSPAPKKDDMSTVDLSMGNGIIKRSYAGVAAPGREGQRRDTVVPPPGKESAGPPPGSLRPPLITQTGMTPPSSTDLQSPSPSDQPPAPPPVYPEAFFWPLLDALEKSRAQVSTPHNRAQSVRHSVVGQELPPSARARLGLTFKEYVAAAARQGVIVTGDSGDKAWIAMREWKYPGKSYNTWPANR